MNFSVFLDKKALFLKTEGKKVLLKVSSVFKFYPSKVAFVKCLLTVDYYIKDF